MRKWMCLLFQCGLILVFSAHLFAQDKIGAVDAALDIKEEEIKDYNESFDSIFANVQVPYTPTSETAVHRIVIEDVVKALDVKDRSLESVLDDISKQTGIIFMLPEVVPGNISLFIEDVNVRDLLTIILEYYYLAYYRTDGAVHIMRKDVFEQRYGYAFPSSLSTKIVPVHYAGLEGLITLLKVAKSAEGRIWLDTKNRQIAMMDTSQKLKELQKIIAQNDVPLLKEEFTLKYVTYNQVKDDLAEILTKNISHVDVDESQTKLTVTDSGEKLKKISAFLAERDKEIIAPFRAKIVRIFLHEEHLQGVDWEAIVSDYQPYSLIAVNGQSVTQDIGVGVVTQEDYDVLIDALDTVGDLVHLISFDVAPVLNREKSVELDTNDPFWALRPGVQRIPEELVVLDSNGFEMRINLTVKKKGNALTLEMLPRLHWMAADDDDDDMDHIFTGDKKLSVTVGENDVIVIGGLIRSEEIARMRKVPLLGDLPMVGGVFRRERTKFENTEYVIFLTPETGPAEDISAK